MYYVDVDILDCVGGVVEAGVGLSSGFFDEDGRNVDIKANFRCKEDGYHSTISQ
jgi:hypothetical protein